MLLIDRLQYQEATIESEEFEAYEEGVEVEAEEEVYEDEQ